MNFSAKVLCLFFLLIMACAGDDPQDKAPSAPTNLTFTVEVDPSGNGAVTVRASADDATAFQVYFGETEPDAGVSAIDGTATYTYSEAGTYTIKVVASNASASTTQLTQDVTIALSPPSALEFTVEVMSDGSGKISVDANALNATKYKVYFGDVVDEVGVTSSHGRASHQYSASGTYTVKVLALNNSSTSIEASDEVAVIVVSPSNLTFTVDLPADNSGVVTVHAAAENTDEFQIYFGEESVDAGTASESGEASHQYGATGNYTIRVVAKNASVNTIEATQEVSLTVLPVIPATGYFTPESYEGMALIWADEFNGSVVNEDDWTFETGGHGWGNNELQYYRKENTEIYNGNLVITARKEAFSGSNYTSSRMITKGKREFKYGRIDIRAALPKGQGIWPALWMLGANIGEVGWPKCGEIDIMEMIGGTANGVVREKTVYGTLHWDNAGSHACTCDKPGHTLSSGIYNDEFHVFSMMWNENSITWYVDDVQFNTISITPAELSEFRDEYFFIFNLAVGGNWPGSPDNSTVFPQRLIVDYVRVFQ
jgi:beta-glucanase (GH16 family)